MATKGKAKHFDVVGDHIDMYKEIQTSDMQMKEAKTYQALSYAQGQSLLVCRWEPSQESIDCIRVYKHAVGFWETQKANI